nr:MAG TPA: hypothetical protein [Caudoviricetes sp.]
MNFFHKLYFLSIYKPIIIAVFSFNLLHIIHALFLKFLCSICIIILERG